MQNYSIKDFSYGVELEYGNCSRKSKLPEGASWNFLDNTCVSSTGIANDPKGELYEFGGEINTKPTYSIEEQIDHIYSINTMLSDQNFPPLVNYRSNLHIHIRVPDLHKDLDSLKNLLRYINSHQEKVFNIVEDVPVPDPRFLEPEIYKWENIRYKRRLRSHQHKIPKTRVESMLNASTPQEFFLEHAHKNTKGEPAWFQCPRAGINLRQMFEETNTIEFRHFPGTLNMKEMESAIQWCKHFLDFALNKPDSDPHEILSEYNFIFPKFEPYEYYTEQVYQHTNHDKNNRTQVKEILSNVRKHINIDDLSTSSKDIHQVIKHLGYEL